MGWYEHRQTRLLRSWHIIEGAAGACPCLPVCQQGVLPEYDAATAMLCVMEALASLHAANVVYGDVKPSNFVRTKVRARVPPAICACVHTAQLFAHIKVGPA